MASDEKPSSKALNDREKSFASVDEYSDDNFNEPASEETLHRGLKARQISMIAVGTFKPFPTIY